MEQPARVWTPQEHVEHLIGSLQTELTNGTKYFSPAGQPLDDIQSVVQTLKETGRVILEPHIPADQFDRVLQDAGTSGR